jgi:hypothetical protein
VKQGAIAQTALVKLALPSLLDDVLCKCCPHEAPIEEPCGDPQLANPIASAGSDRSSALPEIESLPVSGLPRVVC